MSAEYSMNEVEALAKKAVRGAGYPWGIAEDAGKAVRYLCAYGQDGCGALARLLERFDGQPSEDRQPVLAGGVWSARSGVLCPLMAGTAAADRSAPFETGPVAEPLLLIAFAHLIARGAKATVMLDCDGARAVTDGEALSIEGQFPREGGAARFDLGGVVSAPCERQGRACPDAADWEALSRFAHRTYAPATEESRLKGAG